MAERFYLNFPLRPGPVVIQGPEARHLATVLRASPGDAVCLFNGDGRDYRATVLTVGKRDVTVDVTAVIESNSELPFMLEVAAAVPKGDRAEWLVEKLTELGVKRFVPLRTDRSVVHPKSERLLRTAIEASKQCGRNVLMEIAAVTAWREYCQIQHEGVKLLAHVAAFARTQGAAEMDLDLANGASASRILANAATSVSLAIGPEGGFTDEEVGIAAKAGWHVLDLGPRILRIETAAVALAAHAVFANAIKA